MDGMKQEYPQSGLSSPYHSSNREPLSEDASADHSTAAQYSQGQEVKYSTSSSTPASDYGMNPSSSRPGNFPDYMHRAQYPDGSQRHYPPGGHNSSIGNLAQSTSPSMPHVDGQAHDHPDGVNTSSDMEVPIDPSIAAASPTYPQQQHYTTYSQQHDMPHYQQPPGMYQRNEYGSPYSAGHPHAMSNSYGHVQSPVSASPSMGAAGTRPPGVRPRCVGLGDFR